MTSGWARLLGLLLLVLAGPSASQDQKTKVCDVCRCTVEIVDCSNLKLDSNLQDHEWPENVMKIVNFDNNEISHIKQFPNATILHLSFSNNSINKIDGKAFKFLSNLTELDLSHNHLNHENFKPIALEGRYAVEVYEPLGKLRKLNLSGNQFQSLGHDLFEHVRDLNTLILSGNLFETFDHSAILALTDIPNLVELDLSHCKLKELEESTLHLLSRLERLDLSYNKFLALPNALQQCKSLKTLTLDGNPIEFLGQNNSFPMMSGLKELFLRNMLRLVAIDNGAFSNLENLESLIIENCPILSEISDGALAKQLEQGGGGATWPTLKNLSLANNSLEYLPATLLARWDKLEELHLANNQWICDCENQYFIGILLPTNGVKTMSAGEAESLRCAQPPEHLNKTLMSLHKHHLRCLDAYGARPERDAAVLVGMLVGVLLAIPVVLAMFMLWRRGFFFCGDQGPASYSRAFYRRARPCDDDI